MPAINWTEINWLAVIVSAIATFVIGGVWYTALFGTAWKRAQGYTDEQCRQMQAATPMPVFFGAMIVCYLVIALGLSILLQWCGVHTLAGGVATGLLVCVLVIAPVTFTHHISTHVKLPGYLINLAYELIYCGLIGGILGAWH